jgi:hypothetical protein
MRARFFSDGPATPWLLAALIGLASGAAGWGCSGSSGLPTIPVQGRVTYKGQPVTQGTVTFLPRTVTEGTAQRPATGVIQADGAYRLATVNPDDGAMPGDYQVVIVSITSGPSPETPDAAEVWAIPKHYGNPLQTDLQATIPNDSKGPLQFDFDLTDTAPAPRAAPPNATFAPT